MKKINFEDGKLITQGYVEINGVQHEVHEAEYESHTPLSSHVLNTLQDNIEEELITTKTIQGESITIEDACNCNAHLKVYGKTVKEGNVIRNVGDNVNLFDKSNAQILNAYSWDGSALDNGANILKSLYITCKPNTTYTVQKKVGQRFVLTTTAEIPVIGVQTYGFVINETTSVLSITTPSNAKYLIVEYINKNKDTLTEQEILDSIKIEEGSTATSYSNYNCGTIEFEKNNESISFPLSEGFRLHEGDYLADDGIHQNRKVLVLTGTENWQLSSSEYSSANTFSCYFVLGDMKVKSSLYCTHFIDRLDNTVEYINVPLSKLLVINISKTKAISIESFKTYLAQQYANGTPVTVEYELEKERIISYTTEQYNELRLMSEGQNTITTVGDVKPNIKCDYYYNNDLNKIYANRFDKLEIKTIKNENGIATMFPDGTMICRKKIALGKLSYTNTYGNVFTDNVIHVWDFPKQFIDDDISISIQPCLGGGIGGVTLNKNIGKDKLDFFIYSVRQINSLNTTIYTTAIGRWK